MQQRAVEYKSFSAPAHRGLTGEVWDVMPPFPERESALSKRVKKHGFHGAATAAGGSTKDDGSDSDSDDSDGSKSGSDNSDEDEDADAPGARASSAPTGAKSPPPPPPNKPSGLSAPGPAGKKSSGTDDFLGLSTMSSPGPAAAVSPVKPPADELSAFFSPTPAVGSAAAALDDDPFGSAAPFTPQGPPQAPPQDLEKLNVLLTTQQGVLYEFEYLQVGVKMQIDGGGSQCKMIVYYGNKDAGALSNVSLTIPPSPKFKVQVKPEVIDSIAGKAQTPQYLLWHCMQPFDESPALTLSFTRGGAAFSIPLVMPLIATKFVQPVATDPNQFVASWKTMGNEAVEVFRARNPIEIQAIRTALSDGASGGLGG
jgi:hypothetical protein